MANLQVKNIPDDLHERLRRHARKRNCTIGEVVLAAAERELAELEWRERWAQQLASELGVNAADLIREERELRDLAIERRDT
jgi:plasmid stability protein